MAHMALDNKIVLVTTRKSYPRIYPPNLLGNFINGNNYPKKMECVLKNHGMIMFLVDKQNIPIIIPNGQQRFYSRILDSPANSNIVSFMVEKYKY